MKADGTPETEFEESMPLFASILEANHRSLQWTNDQLLANKEAQLRLLRKQFVGLYMSLQKVAERTDSATAYDALDRFHYVHADIEKEIDKDNGSY